MDTLHEYCRAYAAGAASSRRLEQIGCRAPEDLSRFTAAELSALLDIPLDAAEHLWNACVGPQDMEEEFLEHPRLQHPLRPAGAADLDLSLCVRLAHAGVASLEDLAASAPLELARTLEVDVGRMMRLVSWAADELGRASEHASNPRDVLTPAPRREGRFSPAETGFVTRAGLLDGASKAGRN